MAKRRPLTDEEDEVRELTPADFRRMKPIREVDPRMLEAVAEWRKKAGRPKAEAPKVHIGFRLAADVVACIRATGKGYNARVERVLHDAFVKTEHASEPTAVGLGLTARKRKSVAQATKRGVSKRRA
jgi:uncharacterized protein (DUF4415 family)